MVVQDKLPAILYALSLASRSSDLGGDMGFPAIIGLIDAFIAAALEVSVLFTGLAGLVSAVFAVVVVDEVVVGVVDEVVVGVVVNVFCSCCNSCGRCYCCGCWCCEL